jgi:diacylglycerol kinase
MIKKFIQSVGYALQGIRVAFIDQRNLKIQLFIALLAVGAGFYVRISGTEWCLILLSTGLVLGLELMNTALEGLVDLVTKERMPLAGKIKDVAAGAVFIASFVAAIVGVLIFRKYILV